METKRRNRVRIASALNGMTDLNDIAYLQVNGRSQLDKELTETRGLQRKVIDYAALHRNEQTQEVEGDGVSGQIK